MRIANLQNTNRKFIATQQNFHVLEYEKDFSVSPINATNEYFMSKMNVRRRQVVVDMNGQFNVILQAGAMQWMAGNIQVTSGVKGAGDLLGKFVKGAVSKESAVKPEYTGVGLLVLEPTYKYILLEDVSTWGPNGMTIEDGMFLACDGRVQQNIVSRSNLSSAALGGEGLFNLNLQGSGIAALESNVPAEELVTVELNNDELRIDGNLAVCWSGSLNFTVEKAANSLAGSAISGEGLVNVFRGTGKVLMSPVAATSSLAAATNKKD